MQVKKASWNRPLGNQGKVWENIFDEIVREKSWKFMKNCQSKGKVKGKMKLFQRMS